MLVGVEDGLYLRALGFRSASLSDRDTFFYTFPYSTETCNSSSFRFGYSFSVQPTTIQVKSRLAECLPVASVWLFLLVFPCSPEGITLFVSHSHLFICWHHLSTFVFKNKVSHGGRSHVVDTHHSRPLCCCWPPTLSWFHARLVRIAMETYPVKTCDEPMNEAAPDARVPSLVTEKLTDHGWTWMHGDTLHYHTFAHRRKTQKLRNERRSTTVAERATVAVGVEPREDLVVRGKPRQPKNRARRWSTRPSWKRGSSAVSSLTRLLV